jgi:adenylate cyclase
LRDEEARRIEQRLSADLGVAEAAVEHVERALRFGTLRPDDPTAVEGQLFSAITDNPSLSDVTFTRAGWRQHGTRGEPLIEQADPWQISVFRRPGASESSVDTRRVSLENGRFVADVRERLPGASFLAGTFRPVGEAPSPTAHATFATTASQAIAGAAIWSDLAYSELDAAAPVGEQRVTMSVQKAVEDAPGHFAGVVRVGLLAATIDTLSGLGLVGAPDDPRFVFLCDEQGRLVSRRDPGDRISRFGDDLRVRALRVEPPVAAALSSAALRGLTSDRPEQGETLDVQGKRYLASFLLLPNTQDWAVGVVVSEAHYTRDLIGLRNRFLLALLIVTALVLIGGIIVLREVVRGLGRITLETAKMRRFDFASSSTPTSFRDVAEVVEGLERAKTAMRALGKYVHVDLVRTLYASNREPSLGGELLEVSILFTDIRGFTDLSERMSPDALAKELGLYLKAMTRGVVDNRGTVDKFIGDAVMAFWNAPSRVSDHSRWACAAVLACIKATTQLYASPEWGGIGPLFTRFGLHRARVMVGHFGSPDRLSYTALGDGVNLASRLEGLGKQYGVATLASEAIVSSVGDEFEFRLVDKVAVKGKKEAVRVYELLGARGECDDRKELVKTYELALDAYFRRDFGRAIERLELLTQDGPSRTLMERCQWMLEHPPPEGWDGVYVATSK